GPRASITSGRAQQVAGAEGPLENRQNQLGEFAAAQAGAACLDRHRGGVGDCGLLLVRERRELGERCAERVALELPRRPPEAALELLAAAVERLAADVEPAAARRPVRSDVDLFGARERL